jgi:hypothetical protein
MKKYISCFIGFFSLFSAYSQLSNSKWKVTLNIEGPKNVIFDFKKDTVSAYYLSDSSLIETMSFTATSDTLTLKKLDGQSSCDNYTIGKYYYKMGKDKFLLKLVSDDCTDRSSVLDTTVWFRWKDHPAVYVSPSVLQGYVGVYEYTPDKQVNITMEDGKLMIEGPNIDLPKVPLIPESNTRFFIKVAGVELDFVKDSKGRTVSLISHEKEDYELKKIK